VTKLDKPRRREVEIDSTICTLMLSPYKLKLTPKDHRRGIEVSWSALLNMKVRERLLRRRRSWSESSLRYRGEKFPGSQCGR